MYDRRVTQEYLNNIRVVLVGTTHPGNIGAAARAIKTMGLHALHLVAPAVYPHADATARASGADDVLAGARVVETLEDALVGCGLVVGASARSRTIAWPTVEPRECALIARDTAAAGSSVALVFGRERTGLTNHELERCHYLVHIPSNPDYSSLNLAAAVQILAYELRMAGRSGEAAVGAADFVSEHPPATADELEGLYAHLEQTLVEIGFLDPGNPRQLMRRMRRLFNRARLDRMELNILRGALAAAQKRAARRS